MLTVKPAIKEVWASLSWIFREGKDHFSQRIKKGSSELSPKGWGKMGQVSLEWKDTLGRENGKSKELGSKCTRWPINTILPGSIRAET